VVSPRPDTSSFNQVGRGYNAAASLRVSNAPFLALWSFRYFRCPQHQHSDRIRQRSSITNRSLEASSQAICRSSATCWIDTITASLPPNALVCVVGEGRARVTPFLPGMGRQVNRPALLWLHQLVSPSPSIFPPRLRWPAGTLAGGSANDRHTRTSLSGRVQSILRQLCLHPYLYRLTPASSPGSSHFARLGCSPGWRQAHRSPLHVFSLFRGQFRNQFPRHS
jgi:hypothetical protein